MLEKYELTEHFRQVLKLEVKCDAVQKLLRFNENQRQKTQELPQEPTAKAVPAYHEPTLPVKREVSVYKTGSNHVFEEAAGSIGIIFVVSVVLAVIGGVYFHPQINFLFGLFGCFVASLLIGFGLVLLWRYFEAAEGNAERQKYQQEQAEEEHKSALVSYNAQRENQIALYRRQEAETIKCNQQAQECYRNSLEKVTAHNSKIRAANQQLDAIQSPLRNMLDKLQSTLYRTYNLGYVYYEYRNFVAYVMFLKYLDSGRCDELEGHEGAYNLFEHELRLDRIIDGIDDINKNLLHIRQNQYYLFCEISNANKNIEILTSCVCEGLNCIANAQGNLTYEVLQSHAATRNMHEQVNGFVYGLEKTNKEVLKYLEDAKKVDQKLLEAKK